MTGSRPRPAFRHPGRRSSLCRSLASCSSSRCCSAWCPSPRRRCRRLPTTVTRRPPATSGPPWTSTGTASSTGWTTATTRPRAASWTPAAATWTRTATGSATASTSARTRPKGEKVNKDGCSASQLAALKVPATPPPPPPRPGDRAPGAAAAAARPEAVRGREAAGRDRQHRAAGRLLRDGQGRPAARVRGAAERGRRGAREVRGPQGRGPGPHRLARHGRLQPEAEPGPRGGRARVPAGALPPRGRQRTSPRATARASSRCRRRRRTRTTR